MSLLKKRDTTLQGIYEFRVPSVTFLHDLETLCVFDGAMEQVMQVRVGCCFPEPKLTNPKLQSLFVNYCSVSLPNPSFARNEDSRGAL